MRSRTFILSLFLLPALITIFSNADAAQKRNTSGTCNSEAKAAVWPKVRKFESFSSSWKCDEKLLLTSFKVGNSRASLVRGHGEGICGATGNCPTWVVSRFAGRPKIILDAGSITDWYEFNYRKGRPYPDLALRYRMGASDLIYRKYTFDGSNYRLASCFSETYGTDGIRRLTRSHARLCS